MLTLDPTPFNAADVRQVVNLLKMDPLSETLDILFTKREYPATVLAQLRREDFRSMPYKQMRDFFRKTIDRFYNDLVRRTICKPFTKMLIDNDVTLAMRCYLMCRPVLIRAFERISETQETGDYNQCVENYRKRNYTNQVLLYHEDYEDYMDEAVKYGHYDVVSRIIEARPLALPYELGDHVFNALRRGHPGIADLLLKSVTYNPNSILESAVQAGSVPMMRRMVAAGATYFDNLPSSAGISGNIEMIEEVFRLVESQDKYTKCLYKILEHGHLEALAYLRSIQPEIVAQCLQNIPADCKVGGWEMVKLLLSEGLQFRIHFVRYIGRPDFIQIVHKYGASMLANDLSGFRALIRDYNYELFDLLLPYVVKCHHLHEFRYMTTTIAISSNSRYFFDNVFTQIQYSLVQIENLLRAACDRNVQPYFFQVIADRFGHLLDANTNLVHVLCASIRESRDDIFDRLMLIEHSNTTMAQAIQAAYAMGKFRYFKRLCDSDLVNSFIFGDSLGYITSCVPVKISKGITRTLIQSAVESGPQFLYSYLLAASNMSWSGAGIDKFVKILSDLDTKYVWKLVEVVLRQTVGSMFQARIKAILSTGWVTAELLGTAIKIAFITAPRMLFLENMTHILTQLNDLDCVKELVPRLQIQYEHGPDGQPIGINQIEVI